jgi:hypothetical protein
VYGTPRDSSAQLEFLSEHYPLCHFLAALKRFDNAELPLNTFVLR